MRLVLAIILLLFGGNAPRLSLGQALESRPGNRLGEPILLVYRLNTFITYLTAHNIIPQTSPWS